jgi:hypothetical protein
MCRYLQPRQDDKILTGLMHFAGAFVDGPHASRLHVLCLDDMLQSTTNPIMRLLDPGVLPI